MDLDERASVLRNADLYVVITQALCAGRSSVEVLRGVLDAGVRLVQYREKDVDTLTMCQQAEQFRRLTRQTDALLIINDRADVALAVGADGVHLGQSDLPIAAARQMSPELLIGASAHSLDEALIAQEAGASYINIGPIFETATKRGVVQPLGPLAIDDIAPRLSIPWTTMGGIKLWNVGAVLSRGARTVAVVTAVTEAGDVTAAASALRERIIVGRP